MKMKKKYYITTAIDYVNAKPHIGHAFQKIAADVLARWHKQLGEDVFFLTGTDEHGLKVQRSADEAKLKPKEFVDKLAKEFEDAWQVLNLNYDRFIRTTDDNHKKIVQEFIKKVNKSGDIYPGTYEGLYCVGCEAYVTEKDLVNGKCPFHPNRAPEVLVEDTYFFKLSKYQDALLKLYKENPEYISPAKRRDEIINRVKEGLKDLSISRTSFKWGIPFPLNPKHVVYVWYDALINYISALGWPNGAKFKKFWPADAHILGKDNAWFHCVIWPAMLFSAGIEPAKKIYINGFLTFNKQKISKSLGNVIDPRELVKKYGTDAVRYYTLRELPLSEDGDFSEQSLVARHNSELANELGNLVSRVISLIEKNTREVPSGEVDAEIKKLAEKTLKDAGELIEKFELHRALETIWAFISATNKYVQENQPWELAKSNRKKLKDVLFTLAESLRFISAIIYPFIPATAEKIASQIGLKEVPNLETFKFGFGKFGAIKPAGILFPKIEPLPDTQRYEPFRKLDLKVGRIISVEDMPNTEKLYKTKVDFAGKILQVVMGLKKHYLKPDLQDKKAVFVVNLEPTKVCGELSEAMILAANDTTNVEILEAPKSAVGEKVFLEDRQNAKHSGGTSNLKDSLCVEQKPAPKLSFKDFQKIILAVGAGRKVRFSDKVLRTSKEELKVKRVGEGARVS